MDQIDNDWYLRGNEVFFFFKLLRVVYGITISKERVAIIDDRFRNEFFPSDDVYVSSLHSVNNVNQRIVVHEY